MALLVCGGDYSDEGWEGRGRDWCAGRKWLVSLPWWERIRVEDLCLEREEGVGELGQALASLFEDLDVLWG